MYSVCIVAMKLVLATANFLPPSWPLAAFGTRLVSVVPNNWLKLVGSEMLLTLYSKTPGPSLTVGKIDWLEYVNMHISYL